MFRVVVRPDNKRGVKYDYALLEIELPKGYKLATWGDAKEYYRPDVWVEGKRLVARIRKPKGR